MKLESAKLVVLLSVALSATFVLGCTGAFSVGASTTGEVPKMAPGANLPRWEYLCFAARQADTYTTLLTQAGDEGWEMTGISEGTMCFKRPKVGPSAPSAPASGSSPPRS